MNLGAKDFKFKDKRKDWKEVGDLHLKDFKTEQNHTFQSYLRGGMNMQAIVCIDFTGSNGDPRSPTSLHAITQGEHNQYQSAIISVMNI